MGHNNPFFSERPILVDFISTAPDEKSEYENTFGESLGAEALAGDLMGVLGNQVKINHFDLQIDPLKKVIENIAINKPDILPITVKIGTLPQLRDIISNVRSSGYTGQIALGGVVPTFASQQILEEFPDIVVGIGEGEMTMRGLVEVAKGEKTLDDVPNLMFKDENGLRSSRAGIERIDLHDLQFPARITTKRVFNEKNGLIWFEGSRGCDGHCTFCSRKALRGTGFSGDIDPMHVVEDLSRLKEMGITTAHASDDDWAGDIDRIDEIAQGMIDRKLNMQWSVSTRADHIYKEKLPNQSIEENQAVNLRLRQIWEKQLQAGCERVFLGLESFSPSQLKRYGKGISVDANYKAVQVLREIGIDAVAGNIPIDPLMNIFELKENIAGMRASGIYKGVSRVLRQLRIQEGSSYIKMLENRQKIDGKKYMGERTDNLVFYETIGFADPKVQKIADLADRWNNSTSNLDKALNSALFVTFSGHRDQGSIGQIAEWGHTQLTEMGMDFMESSVDYLISLNGSNSDELKSIESHFKRKRNQLIKDIQDKLKLTGIPVSQSGFDFLLEI